MLTVVGLRDRALIALMTFSFARVGATVGMRVEDYFSGGGKRWRLWLNEKGGKVHEMPASTMPARARPADSDEAARV